MLINCPGLSSCAGSFRPKVGREDLHRVTGPVPHFAALDARGWLGARGQPESCGARDFRVEHAPLFSVKFGDAQ